MKTANRFKAPLALAAALALPILTNGCGEDGLTGSLCCTDFKVGADLSGADFGVDASIKGQFNAFAQAAGDLSATATAALDEVAASCKAIAEAGQSDSAKLTSQQNEAATKKPNERVTFWCNLATARINGTLKASGSLKVVANAPRCQASVKAAASCQANCTVDADCQAKVKATPPKCTGGKLEVSCKGSCDVKADAPSISCEGSCAAECSGSCSAQGGVRCAGKCEGECTAEGSANGQAFDAQGNCQGTCKGSCSATPPGIKCSGTCKGQCKGSCTAAPGQASAKCDGECKGTAEPISCKGGKLEAAVDCKVDANCQANCDASVQAKAECTPPQVDITFTGTLTAEATFVLDALRLNLPNIFLVAEARGKAFVDLIAQVSGSASAVVDPGKLGVKGTACLGAIVPVMAQAAENMSAAFTASGSIVASAK